jgi:hypothetical protein
MGKLYPIIFFPALQLQDQMQRATLGQDRWRLVLEHVNRVEKCQAALNMALPMPQFKFKIMERLALHRGTMFHPWSIFFEKEWARERDKEARDKKRAANAGSLMNDDDDDDENDDDAGLFTNREGAEGAQRPMPAIPKLPTTPGSSRLTPIQVVGAAAGSGGSRDSSNPKSKTDKSLPQTLPMSDRPVQGGRPAGGRDQSPKRSKNRPGQPAGAGGRDNSLKRSKVLPPVRPASPITAL